MKPHTLLVRHAVFMPYLRLCFTVGEPMAFTSFFMADTSSAVPSVLNTTSSKSACGTCAHEVAAIIAVVINDKNLRFMFLS